MTLKYIFFPAVYIAILKKYMKRLLNSTGQEFSYAQKMNTAESVLFTEYEPSCHTIATLCIKEPLN